MHLVKMKSEIISDLKELYCHCLRKGEVEHKQQQNILLSDSWQTYMENTILIHIEKNDYIDTTGKNKPHLGQLLACVLGPTHLRQHNKGQHHWEFLSN